MILLLLDQGLPRSLASEMSAREIESIHVGNIGWSRNYGYQKWNQNPQLTFIKRK